MTINFREKANFIWSVADLLRGDYKQSEYGHVILPLTVLRRLDCVLEPTKEIVFEHLPKVKGLSLDAAEEVLKRKAKLSFYNKSKFDFQKFMADSNDIASNLRNYINGFSKNALNILEHFNSIAEEYLRELNPDANLQVFGQELNPVRSLEEIRKDILALEKETEGLLSEVLE